MTAHVISRPTTAVAKICQDSNIGISGLTPFNH
jgi:hypothetical protein